MQDMDDFWTWVTSKLAGFVQDNCPGVKPDLSRLMTAGESAGEFH